jgi:hypothetical protein
MFNFNPDIMRVDGDDQPVRFVPTERTDTSKITDAEMKAASIAAARELAAVPYAELPIEVKKAMTADEKREYVTAQREEEIRLRREEAAAADPLKDPTQRPDAQVKGDNNYIQYYSWVGGYETGSWRLTRVPRNEDNLATYGGRQVGGPTRVSETGQVSDANTLVIQPKPKRDSDGQIIGWEVDGTDAIDLIGTDGATDTSNGIPAGFTSGAFPKALEQFFGSSEGILGYRIETVTDNNGRKYNQLSVATGPNSYSTFGAAFTTGADGKYSIFPTSSISNSTTGTTRTTSTTGTAGITGTIPTGLNAETTALIKSLQDQIASLNKQVTNTDTTTNTLEERQRKENALTSLTARFSQYGLASLVPKIRELVINGSTEATIAFELQETPEYKQRFKANTERLKKGLAVLDAGTYIGMEDSYRQALRAYGLKQFDTDDYVSQFIANDISANELSNRIVTAVQRVQNADPAITSQLREFYNIGQNDLVAYVLDPNQQFQKIERQVQAAEIGVAARRQGLQAGVGVAEQLAAQGVTQAEAQKGYATIADILPDAKKLSEIYGTTLEGYDQAQGEQEVFNQLASAQRRRQRLTQREIAAFGGQSGLSTKALTTDLTGQY